MRAERVDAIEPLGSDRTQTTLRAAAPPQLKIAPPVRNRAELLSDLASVLLREVEALARDKEFTDESNRLQSFNLRDGIDFYAEVARFETTLIKLALDQTGGNQARASRLLHIKPTTLNSKIKLYDIKY